MPDSITTDEFDYNDRYGVKSSKSWVKVAAITALIGVSWLIWAGLDHSRPEIRSTLVAFTVISDKEISIRYQLERSDPKAVVLCTLTARDFNKNVVGQIQDRIDGGLGALEREVSIPTRAAPVNAGIARCRLL